MKRWTLRRKAGLAFVEALAVVSTIALLLAIGFMVCHTMRQEARVVLAENNLKQVSTALELYFRKFGSYPAQGSDLTLALSQFVSSPEVFANPLMDETSPGQTINALYQQPGLDELDGPGHYVTAMVSAAGDMAVVLKTGSQVERLTDLAFDPDAPPEELVAMLDPTDSEQPGEEPESPPEPPAPGSPNDYTEVLVPGVVKVRECQDALFEVIATNLAMNGVDIPVLVEGKFGKAVTYVVVQDGVNRVKFEDAATGLGEDGAVQTDRFTMTVQGTAESVTVTTKAGRQSATSTLPPQVGATTLDTLGFRVTVEAISEDNVYTLSVTSEANAHALSHVEFDFGDGTEVTVSDNSPTRYSGEPLFGALDVDGGEVETRTLGADESFALIGKASLEGWNATYASDFDLAQVLTLRNGDQVPLDAHLASWLFDYLIDPVTRTVTIADNQVLFLFELGVTNPAYFDLDDLVVLVTLETPGDPSQCEQ